MSDENKDNSIIQGIFKLMETIGEESDKQSEYYQNLSDEAKEFGDKTRYYQKNLEGFYGEVKYWLDPERVEKDNMLLKKLSEDRKRMWNRYIFVWVLILIITIVVFILI